MRYARHPHRRGASFGKYNCQPLPDEDNPCLNDLYDLPPRVLGFRLGPHRVSAMRYAGNPHRRGASFQSRLARNFARRSLPVTGAGPLP